MVHHCYSSHRQNFPVKRKITTVKTMWVLFLHTTRDIRILCTLQFNDIVVKTKITNQAEGQFWEKNNIAMKPDRAQQRIMKKFCIIKTRGISESGYITNPVIPTVI